MTFSSDKGVIKLLGLSDNKVADMIGKTRQAVSQGLSQDHYLKSHDWRRLYLYLGARNHPDLGFLVDYVKERFPEDEERKFIFDAGFTDSFEIKLSSIEEATAVIPDYRNFRTTHPKSDRLLKDLAEKLGTKFLFLTSSELEMGIFAASMGMSNTLRMDPLPQAGQYPDMLFINPLTAGTEKYLTCTSDGFQPLDVPRGQAIYFGIKEHYKTLLSQRGISPVTQTLSNSSRSDNISRP